MAPEVYDTTEEDEKGQNPKNEYTRNIGKVNDEDGTENVVPEIHGTEIPPYSRELPGSPGVRRHELPTRHGPACSMRCNSHI